MTNEQAYQDGVKAGAAYEYNARRFDTAARAGDVDYPEWHQAGDVRTLFWDCGLRGYPMPQLVRAVRIGKVPECGRSRNYRDDCLEPGVSVLHLVGQERTDNGTFTVFNGGERIIVEGYLHYRTGSDGEPILVGANEIV